MNYHYVVVGNGRLAKHMLYYFSTLNIPFSHWHRNSAESLETVASQATHILLMINDASIESFLDENLDLFSHATVVHFSGAHHSEHAFCAHPLMTFSHGLYSAQVYSTIPFVIMQEGKNFDNLLPGLPNPHYVIPKDKKAYYHALCVMANNFSTILWQKTFKEFENTLNIPQGALLPILQQTCENLKNFDNILTGPLSRNDQKTIQANLAALAQDPFYAVYQGFLTAYSQQENRK